MHALDSMDTEVRVEGNDDEGKFEDTTINTTSSSSSPPPQITDSVVYKLVRVEGDGRLVPATDDEVMEVEDPLEEEKSEMQIVANPVQTTGCDLGNGSSPTQPEVEGPQGSLCSEDSKVDEETTNAQVEEHVSSPAPSHCKSVVESSKPKSSEMSDSAVSTSVKPDVSKLKGEICLDNLSIKELHETFKATFGRETSVKDKLWLKRRITMGLTNSCDVSTTSFTIKDNKLVKSRKEETPKVMDVISSEDPVTGAINESSTETRNRGRSRNGESDCQTEDVNSEHRAAKRVRKPTKRYIEELSEGESREHSGRVISSAKSSDRPSSPNSHVRSLHNVPSDGRAVVTRLDSLGGSGVRVPYVSRIRRGRPRENFMSLVKFHSCSMGMTAKLVKKALNAHSQPDTDKGNKVFKGISAAKHFQQQLVSEPKKDIYSSVRSKSKTEQDVEQRNSDSSGDNSDGNVPTVPTSKGGMRRKHHRAWTLSEVMKLVEGVSRYGAGRWSEIKRLAFASYNYRTSVDLKDKWRNLLRASFAETPVDTGMKNLRKQTTMPIPEPILVRVRELAEMHAQAPPNLSGSKVPGCSGRNVYETRSGFL